jgi:glycosyltransferase involved in cell wall biosynthesis
MNNILVSIASITYNHEKYISKAIEGALMQKTNFSFEIVIGEDCSTDGTQEIVFEYAKKYLGKI